MDSEDLISIRFYLTWFMSSFATKSSAKVFYIDEEVLIYEVLSGRFISIFLLASEDYLSNFILFLAINYLKYFDSSELFWLWHTERDYR